jgi:hypothetical protein
MSRTVSRFAYRMIVRLHPAWFRDRFGDEMMWIFEEESLRGATARVLLDGFLSLMRQRCRVADESTQTCVASGFLIEDSGIGAGRFVQAALMSSIFFSAFMFLIGQKVPYQVYLRMPGHLAFYSLTLQAPPHIEALSKIPLHSAGTKTDIRKDVR